MRLPGNFSTRDYILCNNETINLVHFTQSLSEHGARRQVSSATSSGFPASSRTFWSATSPYERNRLS